MAGPAVERPGNYIVPIGTPLRFLLEQVGARSSASEIILGGPMMGMTISSLDVPVTKGTSGVLAFGKAQLPAETQRIYSCIKCGECLKVCPKFLNPSQMGLLAAKREYEADGRTLQPGSLLRVRLLQLCLSFAHSVGTTIPHRQGGQS